MFGPELREDMSQACIPLLERNLMAMLSSNHKEIPQIDADATYCRKLNKLDGMLDFHNRLKPLITGFGLLFLGRAPLSFMERIA